MKVRYLTFFSFSANIFKIYWVLYVQYPLAALYLAVDVSTTIGRSFPGNPGACISLMIMMTDSKAKVKVALLGKVLWSNIVCTRIFFELLSTYLAE